MRSVQLLFDRLEYLVIQNLSSPICARLKEFCNWYLHCPLLETTATWCFSLEFLEYLFIHKRIYSYFC